MDTYREKVSPYLHMSNQILADTKALPTTYLCLLRDVREVLLVLQYLRHSFGESGVVMYIHDLWSTNYFLRGFRYGSKCNRSRRTHNLLKPYYQFTSEQKRLEDMLALGDITSMHEVLTERYPEAAVEAIPATINELRTMIHKNSVIQVLGMLAQDQEFILRLAARIHINWMRCNFSVGITSQEDLRLEKTVDEILASSDRDVLLGNVVVDVLAVALFIREAL